MRIGKNEAELGENLLFVRCLVKKKLKEKGEETNQQSVENRGSRGERCGVGWFSMMTPL